MTPGTEQPYEEEDCAEFYGGVAKAIDCRIGQYDAGANDKETPSVGTSSSEVTSVDSASLEELLGQYRLKDLKNMHALVEALKVQTSNMTMKMPCNMGSYLRFLRMYGSMSLWDCNVLERFRLLLAPGNDPVLFEAAASRLFGAIFCMQILPRVTFYELSLLSVLQRTHFKHDRHVGDAVSRICRTFVDSISRDYAANRPYKIARDQLNGFSRRIESYVNAFNGLVNELHVDQSTVPKIVFVLLIFGAEERSIFLAEYGEQELFYCSVRIFYGGAEFAKRLEKFMKTQLFWEFRTEKKKYTLDRLFQTVYKYEYRKLIGGIQRARAISSKYAARHVAVPASAISQQRPVISINIVSTAPDLDKVKTVKTFSPFSRKIAEAAGVRDNIASKRKLNFS